MEPLLGWRLFATEVQDLGLKRKTSSNITGARGRDLPTLYHF